MIVVLNRFAPLDLFAGRDRPVLLAAFSTGGTLCAGLCAGLIAGLRTGPRAGLFAGRRARSGGRPRAGLRAVVARAPGLTGGGLAAAGVRVPGVRAGAAGRGGRCWVR